jgi:hypothetical protein
MFYNEVLPSIAKGNLQIDDAPYNIHFNTAIYNKDSIKFIGDVNNEELPTMIIKNIQSFSSLLLNYISEIYKSKIEWAKPYFDMNDKIEIIRYYLSSMWVNMTTGDFENPELYIKKYLSFLTDNTFREMKMITNPIEKLNNCCLKVENIEEKNCVETPYAFRTEIVDINNEHSFVLPDIKYAIEEVNGEKVAYIYAVQYNYKTLEKNNCDNQFKNKVNRILYKVDEDISKDELDKKMQTQSFESSPSENIIDVTPSHLVALTVALSLFSDKGINKVMIPSGFPIRWYAQDLKYEHKIDKSKLMNYPEKVMAEKKIEIENEQIRIGKNIADKMIRNFRRLEYHFAGLHIYAYPYDIDEFMYVTLSSKLMPKNNNHLLAQISGSLNYVNERKRK